MAASGTITQTRDITRQLEITITGFGGVGNTTPPFLSRGYTAGSAEIVLTAGNATSVSIALQGSNDGTNFITLGTAATAFPAIAALSVSTGAAPPKWYQFSLSGGDGTGVFTITAFLAASYG